MLWPSSPAARENRLQLNDCRIRAKASAEDVKRESPTRQYAVVAEYYDATPIYANRADIAFYVECACQAAGRVLELGCGTGRVLIPTAAAGCEIIGLDSSEDMLDKCREKLAAQPREVQAHVRLVRGDMIRFDLGERFQLVTIPFRGFQHLLKVEDQLTCLESARRHLVPGGRLVFDVFQVDPRRTCDPTFTQEVEEFAETLLPDGRRFRRTSRVAAYHRGEQYNEIELIHYVTHPDGRQERLVDRFDFRYFYPYELEHLLARTGVRVAALYGNFDRSPFRDNSPEMIFVAEKAK